jgi:hypothetical protein
VVNSQPTRIPFWRREIALTRTSAHVLCAAVLWPILTMLGATTAITTLPYFSVPIAEAFAAAAAGTLLSAPDMAVSGAVFFSLSHLIFGKCGVSDTHKRSNATLLLEPALALVAAAAGVSLWYPAVLGQPLLIPFSSLAAGYLIVLLMTTVGLGACVVADRGKRLTLAAMLIGFGILSPVPLIARSALEPYLGNPPDAIILGVDSVSYDEVPAEFAAWVNTRGGTWYEHAVSPGLLTNSVWASILTMQPVREHGVFHTFQQLPSVPPALIASAHAHGYRTVSVFTDQFTCAVGSRAGFDDDRSGPVGWRQLLLAIIADNSLLVPVLKPAYPHVPGSLTPSNHAGTFTYDLRREIRGILRAGTRNQRTLVVAHVNYTHHPAYPSSRDLSWQELRRLASAPAATLRDRSFNWQDRDDASDPVKLHPWKLKHVHDVIASEVDAAGFLGQDRRLALFSDHGDRAGLGVENFTDSRYRHVPLATFGVPARCPREPISLIDVGSLLGISQVRAIPSVEFTIAPQEQWAALVRTSRLRWSGDVDLDPELLAGVFKGLRRYDRSPHAAEGQACAATSAAP